jgi:ubiquinone/menaquinone biosynthesis C-methylase UbiE
VILYNALCHIEGRYDAIMAECRRVLKPEGRILLIATWKMDSSLMAKMFGDRVERLEGNCIMKLGK